MMLIFKILPDFPVHNYNSSLVGMQDLAIYIFATVLLIVVYFKSKRNRSKNETGENFDQSDEATTFRLKSYDILMQPKIDYSSLLPAQGISFDKSKYKEKLKVIAIIAFYYWLFTRDI